MSGCSLHEAFPDTAYDSGRVARKEERKKAQRCKGPALTFLKSSGEVGGSSDLDPDRQQYIPLPPVERNKRASESKEGFANKEFEPVRVSATEEEERELVKNLVGQRVDDVIGEKARKTLPRATATSPAELPDFTKTMYGEAVPAYFGRGRNDSVTGPEGFADFSSSMTDNPGYKLTSGSGGADFLGSFAGAGLDRASGRPLLATPSVNDAWKPLTPSGARTAFFEYLPAPGGEQVSGSISSFSREEKESLLKKLDTLFARLDDLESKKNEYAHAEISLFILSGLFLMFGLESMRKISS